MRHVAGHVATTEGSKGEIRDGTERGRGAKPRTIRPAGATSEFSSGKQLRRYDSLDLEAGSSPPPAPTTPPRQGRNQDWGMVLKLAFQSVGIVYGDIRTSPLYVYASTFPDGIGHEDDILAVLCLIIYTITLITLVKYVFIVLRANDNGDGGTFALYSLICRYAKVGLLPRQQAEDREVSNYNLELPSSRRVASVPPR